MSALSDECGLVATTLLSNHGSAEQTAARAEQLFEQLLEHFARLVGKVGTLALFKRAVLLASARVPWLATAMPAQPAPLVASLRAAMVRQDPSAIVEAFAAVLVDFASLLRKLIGETLVRQLLGEIWPAVIRIEKESL
jgi:hypothetical protein